MTGPAGPGGPAEPAGPSEPTGPSALDEELAHEQAYVGVLYEHLDRLRAAAAAALDRSSHGIGAGTPGARTERDAFVRLYRERVRQLNDVEQRLCFGRLDLRQGAPRYIGRVGISDADRTELLVDWRAPAAEPFYQATAAAPAGVVRRRQLTTRARTVTALSDEVLDLEWFDRHGAAGSRVVIGEGALFASLDAARTGRMGDIVATIQADQDRVIRAPLAGVLVVQGGPGTGKTAVALHRAAFLLYAHRERIERSGVLLVGPNRVFLRYIDQVLPTLGEAEAMVMSTPGELFPGVETTSEDPPAVTAVKGDLRMARVVAEAVRARQRTLDRPRRMAVEGTLLTLRTHDVRQARERARRSRMPHNQARAVFVKEILNGLVAQLARARGTELDEDARAGLLAELRDSADVRRELNWCWAPIGPDRLLRDLFADPARLAEAGHGLTPAERDLLRRERTAGWTVADVALLDEAAELLGDDPTRPRRRWDSAARAEAVSEAEVDYARSVQDSFGGADFQSTEDLAGRYRATADLATVAERAGEDRGWAYGHVIVDEAQELSAMMWRLLMRRCPTRSMTVVGDVAQTGSAAGTRSWAATFEPHVGDRWRVAELTVNYRTPAQIMDLAASMLRAAGSTVVAPRSARVGSWPPEVVRLGPPGGFGRLGVAGPPGGPGRMSAAPTGLDDPAESLEDGLGELMDRLWAERTAGTIGIITPRASYDRVAAVVRGRRPTGHGRQEPAAADPAALGAAVSTLTVGGVKGLEFDTVVVVEPTGILAESVRGVNDLYVALTRATQRLVIAHHDPLPPGLAGEPAD